MLGAIDRKLARALQCLEEHDHQTCHELLSQLTTALPEAMAIIKHENDEDANG